LPPPHAPIIGSAPVPSEDFSGVIQKRWPSRPSIAHASPNGLKSSKLGSTGGLGSR
jgi:hypothetical protein